MQFNFDATDANIVEQLRLNGRANNQQIAEKLGLTATTVSARIKRMEDANQLRVVAVSDFAAYGFNVLLRISVGVDGRPASEVASDLSALPEVFAAHMVTGRSDIDMLVALHDFKDLSEFLLDKLSGVRGIRSMTPAAVVDIIKYQFDVAPIEQRTDCPMMAQLLDSLDQQLITTLSRDARVSNRKIAADLGVTEGTVRGRVKRLQQDGLIAFTAITSFEMRKRNLAFINIQAEANRVRDVARVIAGMPMVTGVLITMGEFNITAMCLVEELDTLIDIASDGILAIEGVHRVETAIAVKTVKYNTNIAKITNGNHHAEDFD